MFWTKLGQGVAAGAAGITALNAITYLDMAVRARPSSDMPSQAVEHLTVKAGGSIPGDADEHDNRLAGMGLLVTDHVAVVPHVSGPELTIAATAGMHDLWLRELSTLVRRVGYADARWTNGPIRIREVLPDGFVHEPAPSSVNRSKSAAASTAVILVSPRCAAKEARPGGAAGIREAIE